MCEQSSLLNDYERFSLTTGEHALPLTYDLPSEYLRTKLYKNEQANTAPKVMQVVEKTLESNKTVAGGQNQSDRVGFSAFLVSLGTLSSRVLGLVRDMMTTAYFPPMVTDAFTVAFRLPNMFRRILGEGALSVSFIPVFSSTVSDPKSEPKKLVNGVFTLLFSVAITVTTLGIIFARPIVEFIAKGEAFAGIPGKIDLTVQLSRIMFVYVLLVSMYAYFMAILNSLRKFWLPAFAPVLWNVAMIASAYLDLGPLTESGEVLAWGVAVGGVLQMGILIPPLVRAGYLPKFTLNVNTPEIKKVFRGFGPSLIGLGIMQITIFINTRFASYLPEGSNTWIYVADRILELPLSLFAVSIGTALMPTLSTQWHQQRFDDFFKTSNYYLRSVLFLAVPAGIGVWVLAHPIVELLFLRKNFTAESVANTASVLQIYSIAILSYSVLRVLAPCFYAIKNTWYPMICSLIGLCVHLILAWPLIEKYGIQGLTTSTVISGTVNMALLFVGFKILIGHFNYAKLFASLFKFLGLGAVMYFILQVFFMIDAPELSRYVRLVLLFSTIGVAGGTYLLLAHLLKLEELKPVSDKINRKFNKILKR